MATRINNHGDIVGQSFTFSSVVHPLLYHDGLTQDLGTLGGNSGSATAINDLGEIIGWSTTTSNAETHAFLYRNGTMTDLGTFGARTNIPGLLSYSYSSAYAINNWGQIVGTSTTPNGIHAFLYWDGTMVDLNDLVKLTHVNGPAGFLALTVADGINDRGQIVGTGRYWDGVQETTRAFLLDWRP
jgi:probable HAF family extracellular repeat protein